MQLNKQLILFRYILRQFGYDTFDSLREEFNTRETGTNSSGHTFFASILLNRSEKLIENQTIFTYDEAIQGYEKKLRENRAEPFLSFKYYQWFSLLFTEYYLDQYSQDPETFVSNLNAYKHASKDFKIIEDYTAADLRKLAFWMATGSGKTLIMHCNYWQIVKYFPDWENIILITPNEGLSRQHYDDLTASGIPAKLYSGSEESLKTGDDEILILEITKLVKEKSGEGVSVDVDHFAEYKNLVFIDEGHKGQKSEERAWKGLREHITRGEGSFTFEYSATFGQIISAGTQDLLQEYGRAIIFDYSYRHFYADGYGKDFSVFNLDVKNEYTEDQNRLLLSASLLGFYEQLELFDKHKEGLRPFNIEKPLWIFVGSKVQGEGNQSDITKVVRFFTFVLKNPSVFQRIIDNIISENSGLINQLGDDIFKNRFTYLKEIKPTADQVLQKVFHGIGNIEAWEIKQADGEIALKTKSGEQYFAVINIGDVPSYVKNLEKEKDEDLTVQDDNYSRSLFGSIADSDSSINILIGSKKFIEGWNSWRVSSMGLMNMGKSEGAQIIQLFGRGVRLKGKELSLKRDEAGTPYHLKALQTISIVGLNASYINRFLEEIGKEVPVYEEFPVKIAYNRPDEWNRHILTFKTEQGLSFRNELIQLSYKPAIANRVTIDLRNKISVAVSSFSRGVADDSGGYEVNFTKPYLDFINYSSLFLEANRYKLLKGYTNLMISLPVIEEIIRGNAYNILSHPEQFGMQEVLNGKLQNIAGFIIKDYINKFYADQEKAFLTRHLTYDLLDPVSQGEMFPASQQMIVRVPKQYEEVIKELSANISQLYLRDDGTIPTLHFSHHLYSPIASWAKGEKFNEIKTVPVRLNQGERDFMLHLRRFIDSEQERFKNKEVFVLRNLSQKGMGFFIESSSFYPDFMIWIIEPGHQHIYFIDPKGIRETRNFNNPKVIFCRDQVKDLEKKINQDLKQNKIDLTVSIDAWILSVTPFKDICSVWGANGATRDEFTYNHIVFIEDNTQYLSAIF
ncbi:MAG TPA: DEAD/DEAH box helicase family protein [Bacteroidales bacterium]|nr:DEAD/DEAH box helicase family protein [Bacteroidales bacterium]